MALSIWVEILGDGHSIDTFFVGPSWLSLYFDIPLCLSQLSKGGFHDVSMVDREPVVLKTHLP